MIQMNLMNSRIINTSTKKPFCIVNCSNLEIKLLLFKLQEKYHFKL